MSYPIMLPSLSFKTHDLITELQNQLARYQVINQILKSFYEASHMPANRGFSVPPVMKDIVTVMGWPGTIVDVIDERLEWQGWMNADGSVSSDNANKPMSWHDEVYLENQLGVESSLVHLDSLVYGCGFVCVGTRSPDDKNKTPLITIESTMWTTGIYNVQKRCFDAVIAGRCNNEGNLVAATLYEPNRTTQLSRSGVYGNTWFISDWDDHNLGRVPVVPFINRPTASRREGRSEITRAIRCYTDIAIRTIMGMETNREFFNSPQRYLLGGNEEAFTDQAGNPISPWQAVMGRVWALERDENDELPTVGQFNPSAARPYLDQVQGLSQLVAAEAGIPTTYLGFFSENPSSADAIRALESRLIKRTERRQTSFGRSWNEVGELAALIGKQPEMRVDSQWRNAATPTQQADADSAMKLVSTNILLPDSEVTYKRINLTPIEKKILAKEKKKAEAKALIEGVLNGPQPVPPGTPKAGGGDGAGLVGSNGRVPAAAGSSGGAPGNR
jgi:hypothetical protein